MAKAKNPYADYEFLRAYQDTILDLREEKQVRVVTELNLHGGRGRITIELTAYEARQGKPEGRIARYVSTWPSATEQSFSAALYSASMRLYGLVCDAQAEGLWSETAG